MHGRHQSHGYGFDLLVLCISVECKCYRTVQSIAQSVHAVQILCTQTLCKNLYTHTVQILYTHRAKSPLLQKRLQGQFPKDAAAAANDLMMTITQ